MGLWDWFPGNAGGGFRGWVCVQTSVSESYPSFNMGNFFFPTYAELLYFVYIPRSVIPFGPADMLDPFFFLGFTSPIRWHLSHEVLHSRWRDKSNGQKGNSFNSMQLLWNDFSSRLLRWPVKASFLVMKPRSCPSLQFSYTGNRVTLWRHLVQFIKWLAWTWTLQLHSAWIGLVPMHCQHPAYSFLKPFRTPDEQTTYNDYLCSEPFARTAYLLNRPGPFSWRSVEWMGQGQFTR